MQILLAPAVDADVLSHEVVDVHERTTALHGEDPVILTECGMCGHSLGVRQPEDPPTDCVLDCPECRTLNRACC